jgi:hypothetical protein
MDTRRMETDSEPERHTCRELAQNIGLRRRFPDDDKKTPRGQFARGVQLAEKGPSALSAAGWQGVSLTNGKLNPLPPLLPRI